MNKHEAKDLAQKMREFAKNHLAKGLKTWKGEPDMVSMIRSDAKDFRKVAKLLRESKVKEAFMVAQCMDTSPRERIPDEIWNAMYTYCYPDDGGY